MGEEEKWLDQPERVDREIDRFVKSPSSATDIR
jgi:hypothetical protein